MGIRHVIARLDLLGAVLTTLLRLFLLEQGPHKLRCIDSHLLRELIIAILDFVLAFDALLSHLSLNLFELFLLL